MMFAKFQILYCVYVLILWPERHLGDTLVTTLSSSSCVAAFEFMKSNPVGKLDLTAFEQSCGVGVVITQGDIDREVSWGWGVVGGGWGGNSLNNFLMTGYSDNSKNAPVCIV